MPANPYLRERRYPRLGEVIPAHFRLFGRRHVLPASIVSLGAGGAALRTPLAVSVHSTLEEVRFALPPIRQQPGAFIAVSAVVRWANVEDAGGEHGFLTGVEFLDVEERAFERIRNYVYYRLLGAPARPPERPSRQGRVAAASLAG
jgi:PilZ domain